MSTDTSPTLETIDADLVKAQSLLDRIPPLQSRLRAALRQLPDENNEPLPAKREQIYVRRCWLMGAPGHLDVESRPLRETIARRAPDLAWRDLLAEGINHFRGEINCTDRREVYKLQRLRDAIEILEIGAVDVMPQELAEWFDEHGCPRWFDGRPGRRAVVQRIATTERRIRETFAELRARVEQVEALLG